MDELNRKNWDKVGKYRARKGQDYIEKYSVQRSPEDYKLMPSRCRARNCCRGFYYDPVTFNVAVASTGAVFENAESPEKADVEGVDEVSSDCDLRDMANSRFPDA